MLLNPQSATGRRVSRGWSVLTAAGVLSAAVLLSGLGLAADKPKAKPAVEVEVVLDDEKGPDKKKVEKEAKEEKKVQKDGDKPKPGTKDGDKPKAGPKDGERAEEIARLKKRIAEAAKAGDTDEMQKSIDQLTKLLLAERERDMPRKPVPGVPPVPPLPEFNKLNEEQFRRALERSMEGFEKAMEKMKDNPEAREAMQKAMEAYKKALEEGLKKGAWAVPGVPGVEGFRVPREGDFRFDGFPREGAFAGRPRLGVNIAPVPEVLIEQLDLKKGRGVLITGVMSGTPAEKAGLRKNDVVLTFAGKDVAGPEAFAELVAAAKAEKVDLTVLRKGKTVELSGVTLADPKKADEPARPAKPAKPAKPEEPRKPTRPGAEAGGKKSSFDTTSITIKDGEFRIKAEKDDAAYEVTGSIEGGKAVPASIVVRADGETIKEKSVEKLPKEHQAAVKELLGSIGVAK